MPSVSIVMPVHDGGAAFDRALDAALRCAPEALEVVVVGDGDGDGSSDRAEARGARVVRLPPPPGGPARARNAGAAAARGEILFFVDADVVVRPDAVARVTAALSGPDAPDAVFGSYDDQPAAPGLVSQYRNLLHHYVHQRSREEAWTFWGACGAVKREAFAAAGGFDERYRRPSVEDIELGARLVRAGRRIRLVKDLQVTHLKRWTPLGVLRTDLLQRALPWTRLLLGQGGLPRDLNLRPAARASVALSGLAVLALLALPLWPRPAALTALAALVGVAALNLDFYAFLGRQRGPAFALAAFPWHVAHYLCGGAGFALGACAHLAGRGGLGR